MIATRRLSEALVEIAVWTGYNALMSNVPPVPVSGNLLIQHDLVPRPVIESFSQELNATDGNAPAIEIEAKVTRLETPDWPERDTAQMLVDRVTEERLCWIAVWRETIVNPANAVLVELGADGSSEPGDRILISSGELVAPGSCKIVVGERVVAKFLVRFVEARCAAEVTADWPTRKWDEPSTLERKGKHQVQWQQMEGRVCWACEELALEGVSTTDADMKRQLVARYGMRFWFEQVGRSS